MYYGEQNSIGTGINFVSGNALRMPDVGEKQGEISMEFEQLHKASEELRGYIGELESRLLPILAPERGIAEGSEKNVPEPVRTPLADTIHDRTQDLLIYSSRVRVLLDRIEL